MSIAPLESRLVCSPCCLPAMPRPELFAAYQKLGFTKYEGFCTWCTAHYDYTGDPVAAHQEAISYGLEVTSFHLPQIGDDIEKGVAEALAAARFAAELAGRHRPCVLFKASSRENYIKAAKPFLDAVEAEGINVTPVLQNHFGTPITTLAEYKEVLDGINDPRMKCILEVGHFQKAGVSWREGWDLLGTERIALIHINDIKDSKSVFYGTGLVDFAGLMRHIQETGYAGNIVVELELETRSTDPEPSLRGLAEAKSLLLKLAASAAQPTPAPAEPLQRDPRVCVIGAGNLSSKRIYPYLGAAGAQLVGTCDLDTAKAETNSRRYGGKAYSDIDTMLAEQKPDAVIICIGPKQHAELAPKIMRMGYPVYTEKPPAQDAAGALEVAKVARETGQLCVTAFKKRYTEAAKRAKEWLAKFDEADYYSMSVDYCSAQYPNLPDNINRQFLLDFTVHILDLTQYLFGDVAQVFAFSKGMDAYAVSVKFANGAVGSLNLNCGRSFSIPTEEVELTVKGGNFMTIHNSSVWKITEDNKPCEWREPSTFTSGGDSGRDTGHLAELEDFIAAVKEGRKTSRSEIYQGYKTMVLYEAIKASAEKGTPVNVHFAQVG